MVVSAFLWRVETGGIKEKPRRSNYPVSVGIKRWAAAAAIAVLPALAISCSYGPPVWRHRVENAMPEPGEHRFAILILSTHYREPRGLAAFPDRGKWRVLGERERLWLADADSDRAA